MNIYLAWLSIHKPGSSLVQKIRHYLIVIVICTDEDPGLKITSFANKYLWYFPQK